MSNSRTSVTFSLPQAKLAMIQELQCPGCVFGPDPHKCESFRLLEDDSGYFQCTGHKAGTLMSGAGQIYLGLPKGFCRLKHAEGQPLKIRLRLERRPFWNRFNVAVWAMERDGFLFVRTYLPRIDVTFLDVIRGGKLHDVLGAINVGEFVEEID